MTPPDPLVELAGLLRAERDVIADHIIDPPALPAAPGPAGSPAVLGPLAAAGPRAAHDPAAYALVIEAVLEGYLLHYSRPRLFAGHDSDLALLAGDHLYALGLERLAALGDIEAVAALSDLISLSAECHAEQRHRALKPLWLLQTTVVGCGATATTEAAQAALRRGDPAAEHQLLSAAESAASNSGIGEAFDLAAKAIDFPAVEDSDLG